MLVGACALVTPAAMAAGTAPEVETRSASGVTATSATIEAGVEPAGSETKWTIALECQRPLGSAAGCEPLTVSSQSREGVLAAGLARQIVAATVSGLQPSYEYKYSVIAQNAGGRAGYVGDGLVTCPATGPCPAQPWLQGESLWNLEGARRAAEEAPRLEREREAKAHEAAERSAREAAERAAHERQVREEGERSGREAGERAEHALRCVVPRLKGDSLAKARRALRGAHCALGRVTMPRGRRGRLEVSRQGHAAGTRLTLGARVALTLVPAPAHASR